MEWAKKRVKRKIAGQGCSGKKGDKRKNEKERPKNLRTEPDPSREVAAADEVPGWRSGEKVEVEDEGRGTTGRWAMGDG